MDLRKSSIYLLVCLVSINAWCTILYFSGIQGSVPTPVWNETAWSENLDVNKTLTDYTWDVPYSDFVFGTYNVLRMIWGLVVGAPLLFTSLGIPDFIVYTLYGIWALIWGVVGLMYWIGGRDI